MPRYPELDLLRTLAVIAMIIYHTAFDLAEFYGWDLDIFEGGWKLLGRGTATLFLILVGVGFAISWNRHHDQLSAKGDRRIATATWKYPAKYLKRGLGLIALGMVISVVTYVVDPETYVRFGILHLIGTGILVLPFFVRLREWNFLIGCTVIFLGEILLNGGPAAKSDSPLLLPLGITPPFFSSVDYFPIFPWFGVMLFGYAIGYFIYVRNPVWHPLFPNYESRFPILWLGRHALVIYLFHQPILIILLSLLLGPPSF